MADYDNFAEAYDAENSTSLLNAHYNKPAMLDLAGELDGRRVLDAGCGAGSLTQELIRRGASVSGFDQSAEMIALARRRLGDEADVRVADLEESLPYGDHEFDVATASLSLHYLEDWVPALVELRRVLRTGGRLVVSVPHPTVYMHNYPDADYFATTRYSETFDFAGHDGTLTYWHRPLHRMVESFTEAGFRIRAIDEPPYSPDTPPELLPADLGDRSRFMCFLYFVVEA